MKIVVSNPTDGKSYQKELESNQDKMLYGKKIGDAIKGDTLGMGGYELELTGGSDKQGFPMRVDFHGTSRKRLLLSTGPGYKAKRKGERRRKNIRGNTVAEDIAQVNLKVVAKGKDPLEKLLGKKEEAAPGKKEEKAKEKKEEKPKAEEKKPEKKEEAPKAEEKKATEKKE
ncbi:MAG: 30S ribosomal protein S6e [Candidatus Diapherotrites archaeon]|nr:30S ribosomal protein S6e [Candidatus Diapherotrites archaeon]